MKNKFKSLMILLASTMITLHSCAILDMEDESAECGDGVCAYFPGQPEFTETKFDCSQDCTSKICVVADYCVEYISLNDSSANDACNNAEMGTYQDGDCTTVVTAAGICDFENYKKHYDSSHSGPEADCTNTGGNFIP